MGTTGQNSHQPVDSHNIAINGHAMATPKRDGRGNTSRHVVASGRHAMSTGHQKLNELSYYTQSQKL